MTLLSTRSHWSCTSRRSRTAWTRLSPLWHSMTHVKSLALQREGQWRRRLGSAHKDFKGSFALFHSQQAREDFSHVIPSPYPAMTQNESSMLHATFRPLTPTSLSFCTSSLCCCPKAAKAVVLLAAWEPPSLACITMALTKTTQGPPAAACTQLLAGSLTGITPGSSHRTSCSVKTCCIHVVAHHSYNPVLKARPCFLLVTKEHSFLFTCIKTCSSKLCQCVLHTEGTVFHSTQCPGAQFVTAVPEM